MSDEKKAPVEVARVEVRRVTGDQFVLSDDFLKGCDVVRALGGSSAAAEWLRSGVPRRFVSASRIFAAGEPKGGVFLVLKGEVRLLTKDGTSELATVRKGELFGEGEAVRICSAIADGEVDVLEFSSGVVAAASKSTPAFAQYLAELERKRSSASAELDDFLNRW